MSQKCIIGVRSSFLGLDGSKCNKLCHGATRKKSVILGLTRTKIEYTYKLEPAAVA